jgi:hypothetical protein
MRSYTGVEMPLGAWQRNCQSEISRDPPSDLRPGLPSPVKSIDLSGRLWSRSLDLLMMQQL